tara:strand:- start:1033 stop:1155 length:123 start_codon:yes stop_codon:yes gene_type:complete
MRLSKKQKTKLDKNKDGKISAKDFALLRNKKKKTTKRKTK